MAPAATTLPASGSGNYTNLPTAKPGGASAKKLSVGGPHPTDGLAGYPARDYFAPAGTGVFAWEPLRVVRVSGSSGPRKTGFGGYNVYLQDSKGRIFFLTHVENLRVKQGTVVKPGDAIAQVGNYPGMAQHVHIGYTGGDPYSVLGLQPGYIFSTGGAVAGSKAVIDRTQQLSVSRQLAGGGSSGGAGGFFGTGIGAIDNTVGGAVNAGQSVWDVAKAPYEAIQWTRKNWDRVLQVTGGFVLLVIGLYMMARSTRAGGDALALASKGAIKSGNAAGAAVSNAANSVEFDSPPARSRRDASLSRPKKVGGEPPRVKRPVTGPGDEIPF